MKKTAEKVIHTAKKTTTVAEKIKKTPRIKKHFHRFIDNEDMTPGLPDVSATLPTDPWSVGLFGLPTMGVAIGVFANGVDTGWKVSVLRSATPGHCHVTISMCSKEKASFYVFHASEEIVPDKKVQGYIIGVLSRLGAGKLKVLGWDISYFAFAEDLTRHNPNLEAYRFARRCGMLVDFGLTPKAA